MALSQVNAASTPLDEQQLVDLQTVIEKLSAEQNDSELIGAILDATGADGGETVVLSGEAMELRQALSERLDLTRLHPAVAKAWAHLVDARELKELSRDAAKLRAYAAGRQLIDLLTDYPGRVAAPSLAGLLHPLQARLHFAASNHADGAEINRRRGDRAHVYVCGSTDKGLEPGESLGDCPIRAGVVRRVLDAARDLHD